MSELSTVTWYGCFKDRTRPSLPIPRPVFHPLPHGKPHGELIDSTHISQIQKLLFLEKSLIKIQQRQLVYLQSPQQVQVAAMEIIQPTKPKYLLSESKSLPTPAHWSGIEGTTLSWAHLQVKQQEESLPFRYAQRRRNCNPPPLGSASRGCWWQS